MKNCTSIWNHISITADKVYLLMMILAVASLLCVASLSCGIMYEDWQKTRTERIETAEQYTFLERNLMPGTWEVEEDDSEYNSSSEYVRYNTIDDSRKIEFSDSFHVGKFCFTRVEGK